MKSIKNNIKLFAGIIIGILISGVTVYAVNISSSNIEYDNTNSGLTSTNVESAINELYKDASGKLAMNTFGEAIYAQKLGSKYGDQSVSRSLDKGKYIIIADYSWGSSSGDNHNQILDCNRDLVCSSSNCVINKLSGKSYLKSGDETYNGSSRFAVWTCAASFYVDIINDVDTIGIQQTETAWNAAPVVNAIQAIPINN